MNDNYEEINTFLKTQKNAKTNILKERVRATQQKEEETGETSCREKSSRRIVRILLSRITGQIRNWSIQRARFVCRVLALAIV